MLSQVYLTPQTCIHLASTQAGWALQYVQCPVTSLLCQLLLLTEEMCWREGGGVPGQPLLNRHQVGVSPAAQMGCWRNRAGAHQGQTSREGEKDIWWTAGTARGGTGHLDLTHTESQRGRLWTACGQRRVDSKNSQTTPATTSTSSIRQLLGTADAQTAHHATFSTAPTHQLLGSANAETTPARAPAAAADRKQQPDATCEGKNG